MKRSTDDEMNLQDLANEYNTKGKNMTRTIVFTSSINKAAELNLELRELCKDKGRRFNENGELIDYFCDHYYSDMQENCKLRIFRDFADSQSFLRVLFSTIGYGMGMHMKQTCD